MIDLSNNIYRTKMPKYYICIGNSMILLHMGCLMLETIWYLNIYQKYLNDICPPLCNKYNLQNSDRALILQFEKKHLCYKVDQILMPYLNKHIYRIILSTN